jgi:ABC-type multidrug transport system ATPase subunit
MFCSHILEVVERVCTRLAVVNEGRIIATGSPSEILEQTSQTNLEGAFSKLTGSADVSAFTDEFLLALEKV